MNSNKKDNQESDNKDSDFSVNDIPIQPTYKSMKKTNPYGKFTPTENDLESNLDSDHVPNDESSIESKLNKPSEVEALHNQIHELDNKLQEAQEKALKALSNLENTRKRLEKERLDALKFGAVPFIKDTLSIADNLERAISSGAGQELITKDMWQGVEITAKDIQSVFKRHSIEKISPEIGTNVDYENHQAIGQEESNDIPEGAVARVLQVGYKLHDRLLRPANIMVAIAKSKESIKSEEANNKISDAKNTTAKDNSHKPYDKNV